MYQSRRLRFRSQYQKQKLLTYGLIGAIGTLIAGFILSLAVFAWFARDLPSPSQLSSTSGASTVFYDREGKVLYEMYKDKNRIPVRWVEVPKTLKEATIAIEDKNFYKHQGISQFGIVRAALNVILGRGLQSGSTITQQLIKNVLLTTRQTISRKVKEIILAIEVERRYKKDEILLMYLNESPYGGVYWGVEAAAKGYFNKPVNDLTLVESAILAGLPQNPSRYSPHIGSKDAWKYRTQDVLRRMREDGYISREEEKNASTQLNKITFTAPKLAINAPHFVFYVKDFIDQEYGQKLVDEGVEIKTTLSKDLQETAEKIVKEEVSKLKEYNATNAAVVVLDSKTGEILAMVGSYDFEDVKFGKFNAALGLRQPGSAIKPITYATAFEKGYTPATVLMDVSTEFSSGATGDTPYRPVNYDGKFRGPMQVRFTLGNSENIPAVKMLAMVGIRDFLQKAADMGLTQLSPTEENLKRFGLAITLGGGETTLLDLTSAFSVFAAAGMKHEISAISEITDFKGKNIYKKVKNKEQNVLSPEVSFLVSHILSDNNARLDVFGPNSYLNIPGKTVAVKTGTSDDKRDNWAVGYTNSVTVGVWAGNNDNSPMNPKIASGATGASSIFYRLMREILTMSAGGRAKYEDGIIAKPDKVKAVTIDSFLGGLPKDASATRAEYFVEGTEPKDISPFYKKLKISKSTGRLANDVEIKNGNYEEKEFIVITEDDPVSGDGKNRWQEAINEWAKGQDDRFKPPTEVSEASAEDVVVSIKSPTNEQKVDDNNVEIKAKITSGPAVKNVKIKINGDEVKSIDGDREEINEPINLGNGVYELEVIAVNDKDKTGSAKIKFGVKMDWNATPTP